MEESTSYQLGEPIGSLILQTDGEGYELILAGKGGLIRKHELWGPYKLDPKKARQSLKFLFHVAYQAVQDEVMPE